MIILDTNVLSALMRQTPEQEVVTWVDQQPRSSVWTTAVTVFEIRFGLHILPHGKRRSMLIHAFERLLTEILEDRVVPFDGTAAEHASSAMAARQKKGRPIELRDAMIAGIVLASNATLLTRNVRHFADLPIKLVNPWEA
jgi:hypothetical protein